MIIKSFIQNHIPTITKNTSGNMAILTMEEYKTSALIILEKEELIGCITEDEILDMPELNKSINSILGTKQKYYLTPNNHFCEALKMISETKTPLVPIIEHNTYLGYISFNELVSGIGALYQSTEIGVLKINTDINNYSLAEISRLIELNNGLIITSFLEFLENKKNIIIHLVINQNNLTRIIKALQRHEWDIQEVFTSDQDSNDFNDRFDSFIRYLNT